MRQALTAIASCLVLVACGDSTAPSVATSLEVVAAATQAGTAGKVVLQTPAFLVKDQNGTAMAGVPVTVVVVAGGGTITNAPTQSSAGPTAIGQWTLGQTVGANTVRVTAADLASVTITAQGEVGPLARLTPAGSVSRVGRIGGTLTPGPRIFTTDEFDNRIAGATVTIEPSAGSTVEASEVVSAANGEVLVSSWVLGDAAGEYTLTFSTGELTAQFTATANSGPAASISLVSGGGQTLLAGTPVTDPVRLRVVDEFGTDVDFENVGFTVVAGGGTLATNSATTNAEGLVDAPVWTMGRSAVPQTLRVAVGTVTLNVTFQIETQFDITLRFVGAGMTPSRMAVFERAAQRIRSVITGDLPDVPSVSLDMGGDCGLDGETYVGPIDDVVIYAAIDSIDGPAGVLGRAGPCWIRGPLPGLPVAGVMIFDKDDVANLEIIGRLEDVILHEMLHVLGVGTYWLPLGLLQSPSSLDVRYNGPLAVQGCQQSGGAGICASNVPVHSCSPPNAGETALQCPGGTANLHWRESTFGNELMTGFLNAGANLFSSVTIGGLADLGYQVNHAARDPYVVPSGGFSGNLIPGTGPSEHWETLITPVGTVDPGGRTTRLQGPN